MIELIIVLALIVKGLVILLKFLPRLLKRYFKKQEAKKKKKPIIYAEDIIYNTNKTYILYSIVQNNFNYCMKNKLLKRKDVLKFKSMVNEFADQSEFKSEKFQNDAHEIYRKLKSKSISNANMLKLNKFLQPYIVAEVPQLKEETIQKYGNLMVVK